MRQIIAGYSAEEIRVFIDEVRENWAKFPGNTDLTRNGFVVVVQSDEVGLMPPVFSGEIQPVKALAYLFYASEKAFRLQEHPEHVTSRISADPEAASKPPTERKYGGAVRTSPRLLIVSTSGLTWDGDQSISTAVLDRLDLLDDNLLEAIKQESEDETTAQFVLYDRAHRP